MITQLWGVPVYKQSTNQTLSTFSDEEIDILKGLKPKGNIF